MASKFFRGFSRVFKGPQHKGRVATIGGVKPKISTKKADQIKKSNKLIRDLDKTMKKDMSPQMKKRGEKLKKEVQKTQKEVYRSKMAEGGMLGKAKKFLGMGTKGPKSKEEIKKITSSDAYKKADYKTKTKMLGGNVSTAKEMEERIKKQKPSIREQIAPKKKMDRLKELRKELGAGGGVRGSTKSSDIYSRIKQRHRLKKIRKKFGGGKK